LKYDFRASLREQKFCWDRTQPQQPYSKDKGMGTKEFPFSMRESRESLIFAQIKLASRRWMAMFAPLD